MRSFSYTKLNDYAKCPFYFKCRHDDDVKVEPSKELRVGSAVHAILAEYTNACIKKRASNLIGDWEDIAVKALKPLHLLPEHEDEALDVVEDYISSNEMELEGLAEVEEEVAVNREFQPVGWKDESVWFRAKFDRLYLVGDQAKIRDYKSGYSMSPDVFQFEVYAWIAYNLYPQLQFVQGEFDFVRFAFRKLIDIPREQLPRIDRKIRARIEAIEDDTEFAPRINSLCRECPFWKLCPAIKKSGQGILKVPENEKEAQKLLAEVVMGTKKLKELKTTLKRFCETHGPVDIEDVVAEMKRVVKKEYNVHDLIVWGANNGIEIAPLLSVNGRKIKAVQNIPAEIITESVGTRFTIHGFDDDEE